MPNILFYSTNDDFKSDLVSQIAQYAKEFEVFYQEDGVVPDILMVDDDLSVLKAWQKKYENIPSFLFTSVTDLSSCSANHLIFKPMKLTTFLDELHACLNLFENSTDGYLSFNDYEVRPIKKDIINHRNNEVIKLTEKEVAVIKYLFKANERVVSKNELLQEVWGYAPDATTHTIETHIYRLRQKVEHDDSSAQLIITLEGGYKLKV